jgi:hypothetical protein
VTRCPNLSTGRIVMCAACAAKRPQDCIEEQRYRRSVIGAQCALAGWRTAGDGPGFDVSRIAKPMGTT